MFEGRVKKTTQTNISVAFTSVREILLCLKTLSACSNKEQSDPDGKRRPFPLSSGK